MLKHVLNLRTFVVLGCAVLLVSLPVLGKESDAARSMKKVGVIITLGYGHYHEAKPTFKMVQRVLAAIKLYRAKRTKYIMVCGGYTSGHVAEAEEMKIMALAYGIPSRAILLENGSMTTGQNRVNAEFFVDHHRFRSAAIVSHESHLDRAVKQFKRIRRFKRVTSFAADEMEIAPQNLVYDEKLPSPDEFDAIVIHGKSDPIDYLGDTVQVDRHQRSLARTAADLYQKGFDELSYFIWHPSTAVGHITRAEIIGIAAIGFGLPGRRLIYDEARRYAPEKKELFDDCKERGWKRILAVLPRSRADKVKWVTEKYEEAGLEVKVILTGKPPRK